MLVLLATTFFMIALGLYFIVSMVICWRDSRRVKKELGVWRHVDTEWPNRFHNDYSE